jgi:methyltransferase, FkbM family
MKILNKIIGETARIAGYQITRIPIRFGGVEKFLLSGDINVVIDIGANVGHFGLDLRKFGFKGKIYSFEPLSTAYNELAARAGKDEYGWKTFNMAIGETDTISEINIAANSDSSSLRGMLPLHLENAPESKYIGKEKVIVKKLDSLFPELCTGEDKVWLKIDTQGYEINVLEGAGNVLQFVDFLQLEMSFVPLYDNQMLFEEMHNYLSNKGFSRISIQPAFINFVTGEILQVDGIYQRVNDKSK